MNLRSLFAIGLFLWSMPIFAAPSTEDNLRANLETRQADEEKSPDVNTSADVSPAEVAYAKDSLTTPVKSIDLVSMPRAVKALVLYPMLSGDELNRVSQLNQLQKSALRDGSSGGTYINLKKRKISDKEFKLLFTGEGTLSKVKRLNLAYASFNHDLLPLLPASLVELNLRETSLRIRDINKLAHLTNLQVLDIGNDEPNTQVKNKFGFTKVESIPILESLSTLDISRNNIGDQGALYVSKLKSLEILNISDNRIKENGVRAISTMRSLHTLDISSNWIGVKGAEFISGMGSLLALNISGNDIGDMGARFILRMKPLQTLNIGVNDMREKGAEAISNLKSLRRLMLSQNNIGDPGAESLSKLESLRSLNIACNEIGNYGAKALSQLKSLQTLEISHNSIGVAGAEALSKLESLRTLEIADNFIGDLGAQFISTHKSLHTLNVRKNRVGAMGAEFISSMESLHTLDFSFNEIARSESRAIFCVKKSVPNPIFETW